jgi:hypothetical protein
LAKPKPASELDGNSSGSGAQLSWTASAEPGVVYRLFASASVGGPYTSITATPVTTTSYYHPSHAANLSYMVRALKARTTGSGSYANISQGSVTTIP